MKARVAPGVEDTDAAKTRTARLGGVRVRGRESVCLGERDEHDRPAAPAAGPDHRRRVCRRLRGGRRLRCRRRRIRRRRRRLGWLGRGQRGARRSSRSGCHRWRSRWRSAPRRRWRSRSPRRRRGRRSPARRAREDPRGGPAVPLSGPGRVLVPDRGLFAVEAGAALQAVLLIGRLTVALQRGQCDETGSLTWRLRPPAAATGRPQLAQKRDPHSSGAPQSQRTAREPPDVGAGRAEHRVELVDPGFEPDQLGTALEQEISRN